MGRYTNLIPMGTFVLIHAPLAGPSTWSLVAYELRFRGHEVLLPALPDARDMGPPYWPKYATAIANFLVPIAADVRSILVAHSGAGLLLPLVREAVGRPVASYLFVDAMIPEDGMVPDESGYFQRIAVEGFIPPFSEAILRAVGLEDDAVRGRLVSELRPLPLAVYQEAVPVFAGWPDASCAYLRFTHTIPTAYERFVERARREGWAYAELDGNHFHMLVEPRAVAEAILGLVGISRVG